MRPTIITDELLDKAKQYADGGFAGIKEADIDIKRVLYKVS